MSETFANLNYKRAFFIVCGMLLIAVLTIVIAGFLALNNSRDERSNNQQQQALEAQNSSLNNQVSQLSLQNSSLQAILNSGSTSVASSTSSCGKQLVEIRFGEYQIPCNWHSYFEIRMTEKVSHGFIGSHPITFIGASDAPVGDAYVEVTQFNETFDNYTATPVEAMIAQIDGILSNIEVVNVNNIRFRKVVATSAFGDFTYYFAQKTSAEDSLMISFSNSKADTDVLSEIVANFKWSN